MKSELWINPAFREIESWTQLGFAGFWAELEGPRIDRNRLRQVELVETPLGTAYLKRFFGVQLKNEAKLRLLTRPHTNTQAGREHAIIDKLTEAGFHPPVVLARGEESRFGHELRSLLLTLALPGKALCDLPTEELDEELLLSVAKMLGEAVRSGIYLPDLGLDHVFKNPDWSFGLIDFHNARCTRRPSARELGRAIVRFFKSPGGGAFLEAGLFEPFARSYLQAAERPEAFPRALELGKKRLKLPQRRVSASLDSSWRYDMPGKAQAFAERSSVRQRAELRLLKAVLEESDEPLGLTLDAACGTGRLYPVVQARGGQWIGLDRSAAMLGQARKSLGNSLPLTLASLDKLPFADRGLQTVLCFRFLHHLETDGQERIVSELSRVTDRLLLLSAFHPISAHGIKRRFGGLWKRKKSARHPTAPKLLQSWLSAHGFEILALKRQGLLRDLYLGLWRRKL